MLEVLQEALRPINLPLTALLGVVALYWLLVALGALGVHLGGDVHLDTHADAGHHLDLHGHHDVHGHADAHAHGQDHDGGSWLGALIGFVNLGEAPITLALSFMVLFTWCLSILVNHYWTGGSLALGAAALLPIVIASAIITRYATLPFRPLMRALNRDGDEHVPLIGRTCQVTTSEANARFGQAVIETKGAPLLIDIRMSNDEALPRGATGLIVRRDEEKGIYFIVPVSSDKLS